MADVPFACTTRAREIRVYVQTNRYINIFPISIERFLFAYATIIPIYLYFILLYVVQKKKKKLHEKHVHETRYTNTRRI